MTIPTVQSLKFFIALGLLIGCQDESPSTLTPSEDMMDASIEATQSPDALDESFENDASLPPSQIIFVDPLTSPTGDGSRFRPFQSVNEAYDAARAGDIVLLLPGEYDGIEEPPPGVVLQGSGREVTHLRGPLVIRGSDAEIAELTIMGGEPALHVEGSAQLLNLHLDGSATALRVSGHVMAQDLTVSASEAPLESPIGFLGIEAQPGAAVKIEQTGRLVWNGGGIHRSEWIGVRVRGALNGENLLIQRTTGPGILLEGGQCQLSTVRLESTSVAGVMVLDGRIEMSGGHITDVQESDLAPPRDGVLAYGGITLISGFMLSNVDTGVRVNQGSTVQIMDVTVEAPGIDGVSADGGQITGRGFTVTDPGNSGVSVVEDSHLVLEDVRVTQPGRIGILVDESRFALENVTIDGSRGRGMTLSECQGELTHFTITGVEDVGLQVTDILEDVIVSDGEISASRTSGIAVTGRLHPVTIDNLHIEGIVTGAADLAEGVHLYQGIAAISNLTSEGNAGSGILAEFSTLRGENIELHRNGAPGIVCVDTADDTQLNGVRASQNQGVGALVLQGHLGMNDYHVEGTVSNLSIGPGDGITSAAGGSLHLTNGRSDDNQGSGYSVQGVGRATFDSVSARNNRSWGLQINCGQPEIIFSGTNHFEGNGLGAQNCP